MPTCPLAQSCRRVRSWFSRWTPQLILLMTRASYSPHLTSRGLDPWSLSPWIKLLHHQSEPVWFFFPAGGGFLVSIFPVLIAVALTFLGWIAGFILLGRVARALAPLPATQPTGAAR